MLTRIIQGRAATISHTFYQDSTPIDPSPDEATVTITRDDGTTIVDEQPADSTGAGVVSYPLTPTETALLDRLKVTWTATLDGQPQSFTDTVEIAGDVLFTIPQLRATSTALQDAGRYPESELITMRTTVEDAIESELGYALVPRYARSRTVRDYLRLNPYVRAIRSVTSNTTPVDTSMLTFSDTGFVTGYRWGGVVDVAYEHGLDAPSPRAVFEALTLARSWLIRGPIDDRVTTVSSPDTGITSVLSVPGRGGSVFGIPSVDAFIQSERLLAVA